MPPKKVGKKKGKKKTKAQEEAERLVREEEERKAAEAEAKRLEQERLAREDDERKRRELEAQRRKEELERLGEELVSNKGGEENRAKLLEMSEFRQMEEEEWGKYLGCEPRPDPSVERELNTYINTWREQVTPLLDDALAACNYTELIAQDLLKVRAHAEGINNKEKVYKCNRFLWELRGMISGKLDQATAHLLQHSDEHTREDAKNEVMVTGQCGELKLGVWVNLIVKGFRMKTLNFSDIGIVVDIPKPLALQRIAVRVQYFPFDHISASNPYLASASASSSPASLNGGGSREEGGAVGGPSREVDGFDEAKDLSLGGVFYVELLALPPSPKRVKGWTLRQVTALTTSVQRLTYPIGAHEGAAAAAAAGSAQPLRIQYPLPYDVVVGTNPRVGWWDVNGDGGRGKWSEEGITEVQYNDVSRTLHFHTVRLTALAVIQSRRLDLALASWSLLPVSTELEDGSAAEEEVQLTLDTGRFIVKISIREGVCQLLLPDAPELAELRSTPLPAGQLLNRLRVSGINLLPRDSDAADTYLHSSTQPVIIKRPELERWLEREVASVAPSFEVRGSRWNHRRGADQGVFLMRESGVFTGGDGEAVDFKTVLFELDKGLGEQIHSSCPMVPKEPTAGAAAVAAAAGLVPDTPTVLRRGDAARGVKCVVVQARETDVEFNPAVYENSETHVYLRNCLGRRVTPESLHRVANSSVRFQQTIQQVLHLVRPFSFS